MKLGKLTFRPAYSKEMHVPARAAVHKVIEDAKMPTETFTDSTVSISFYICHMVTQQISNLIVFKLDICRVGE